MRQELHLFIEDKEIEFNQPPSILYNYTETDATNPTVVKNSYSKTLTIEGTPNNNNIFGHIWNLERYQIFNESYSSGSYFNPLDKAEFKLFLNGEIYESGYVRLDEVRRTGNNVEYDITLFGGLGSFFFNLSYSKNSNGETEGPDKLSLYDLKWANGGAEPNLDFTISKDTIWDAWSYIQGKNGGVTNKSSVNRPSNYLYDDKWDIINFAPCYNGLPDDFDTNKVLINYNDFTSLPLLTSKTESGRTYTVTTNGFALGECNDDLTEWMTFDLRSYCQRPVINMKRIIDACCDPQNNGGYEVDLDSHFFNNDNPYYNNAWMTLPLLKTLDITPTTDTEVTDYTLTDAELYWKDLNINSSTISSYNNVSINVIPRFKPSESFANINSIFTTRYYEDKQNKYSFFSALIFQVVAYNAIGDEVGASDVFYLHSPSPSEVSIDTDFSVLKSKWDFGNGPTKYSVKEYLGHFVYDGSNFVWASNNGSYQGINVKLNTDTDFHHLKIKVMNPSAYTLKYKSFLSWGTSKASETQSRQQYFSSYEKTSAQRSQSETVRYQSLKGSCTISIDSMSVIASDYDSLFSGTYIDAKQLLKTDKSPCDYLLSYCKMFGLYFYKDAAEVSTKDGCNKGVIHIMDRNNFYDINNVVNLESLIDRSKSMKITPQVADSKWYDFTIEQVDSIANSDYKGATGMDYGTKRINTGYNFNADKKELLDSSAFKAAVMVREYDRYYSKTRNGVPDYIYNGFKYYLYNNGDSTEIVKNVESMTKTPLGTDGLSSYDGFAKPQFHTEDNSPSDGDGVLLFFAENKGTNGQRYWITDDVEEMTSLNDATPCWIMTNSIYDREHNKIAYSTTSLPYFSRYIINNYSGIITHSWDMGDPLSNTAKETISYIPNTYFGDDDSIYAKCWSNYMKDMYNVNSKVLKCSCLLENRPNPEWLRRFYWFDNSIWRLNKISDWNVSSYDTTQMEFIKVQDLEDYAMDKIDYNPIVRFTFNDLNQIKYEKYNNGETRYYNIGVDAVDLEASIYISNGEYWTFGDNEGDSYTIYYSDDTMEMGYYEDIVAPQADYGDGSAIRTFHIPQNTSAMARKFHFYIRINGLSEDSFYSCYITQAGTAPYIQVTPQSINLDYNADSSDTISIESNTAYNIEIDDNS